MDNLKENRSEKNGIKHMKHLKCKCHPVFPEICTQKNSPLGIPAEGYNSFHSCVCQCIIILPTECNSATTPKMAFAVNITIELKNITTSDNTAYLLF
jgi:hypothetical protein